jgi:ABC-type transporter Mla subunit MlaD
MPQPRIEPGEPNPGGVDAIEDGSGPIAIPDLSPAENPAMEEKAPERVMQQVDESEDTSTQATRDEGGSEGAHRESSA